MTELNHKTPENPLTYSDNFSDFSSEEVFANFREIKGGDLKPGSFYRSASPASNRHLRAQVADKLAKEVGVRYVINLADSPEKYNEHKAKDDFKSFYYDSLYKCGDVDFLSVFAGYDEKIFAEKISGAFYKMTSHKTPCLIHCLEGKDRSGYACAVLLALAGASEDEIVTDYMITYFNYYGISSDSSPALYDEIKENITGLISYLKGLSRSRDIKKGAEEYLAVGGLDESQIKKIELFITRQSIIL